MTLFPAVIDLLEEKGAGDVTVFGGGIIPSEDITALKQAGVGAVFTPGTTTEAIVAWVRGHITPKGA